MYNNEHTEPKYIDWDESMMVEVTLNRPDDFNIARETLRRVGILSKKSKTLYPSVVIFHKRGTYRLAHFKEMLIIDGGECRLTHNDIQRRNRICSLLRDWGIVNIIDPDKIDDMCPMNQIKVLSHKEAADYEIIEKYTVGKKKHRFGDEGIDRDY